MKRPTTDQIRNTAISILSDHMEGIKQVDLWRMVEKVLSHEFETDYTQVKNALWDLEKTQPEYVTKVSKGRKNTILYPTTKLVHESNMVAEEPATYSIEGPDGYDQSRMYLRSVILPFIEAWDMFQKTTLEGKLILARDYINEMHQKEIEVLVVLESIYSQFSSILPLMSEVQRNILKGRRSDNDYK